MKQNIFLSAFLHLLLAAVMALSLGVVMDRAMMVAPDRIEITEIDLNDVQVTGDETKLVNTTTPQDAQKPEPESKEPVQVAESKPDNQADVPLETVRMDVPSDEMRPAPAAVPEPTVKPVDTPMPKKKTVVRVNRETVTRTMTVSVTDALRVAMTRCWVIDTTRDDLGDIRAVAHLTMTRRGTVAHLRFDSEARAQTDPAFAYVLDTIRDAITACSPFKMLPVNEFETWEKIELTFYPTTGQVM